MEETKQKVKVYSTPTCSYCVAAKDFFKEKGVEFENLDVSQDKQAADEMVEKTGQMGVPVIVIGDNEPIVGFDKDKVQALLAA
jgi:glutaredoxin-like YruB-family protein